MIGISTGGNKLDNKILDCYCKDDANFSQIAKIVEIDENHNENIIYEKSINFPRKFTNEGVTGAYVLPTNVYKSVSNKDTITAFFKILSNIETNIYILDWNGSYTVRVYYKSGALYVNTTKLGNVSLNQYYSIVHGYNSWRFRLAAGKENYPSGYSSFQPPGFTWRPIILGDANDNVEISNFCISYGMTTIESKGFEFGSWHAFTSNDVYFDGKLIKGFVDKQANKNDRFVFNYDCILDKGLTKEVEKMGTDYNRTRTKTGKFLEFRHDYEVTGEIFENFYPCVLKHRIAATQSTDNQIHYISENGFWDIVTNKFSAIKKEYNYRGGVTCYANKGSGVPFHSYNPQVFFTNCCVILKFRITAEIISEEGFWSFIGEYGNYNEITSTTLEITHVIENLSDTNYMPVPTIYNGSNFDRHFSISIDYYIL